MASSTPTELDDVQILRNYVYDGIGNAALDRLVAERDDAIAALVSERVERRRLERELEELRGSAPTAERSTPLEERAREFAEYLLADLHDAEQAEEVLREALKESDALIRFLRPDLSHTRSRADRIVAANRDALASSLDSERPPFDPWTHDAKGGLCEEVRTEEPS